MTRNERNREYFNSIREFAKSTKATICFVPHVVSRWIWQKTIAPQHFAINNNDLINFTEIEMYGKKISVFSL